MIKGDVEIIKDDIGKIPARSMAIAKRVFSKVGKLTASYLRIERFTGGTSATRLAVRSGRLRASVSTIPPQDTGEAIEGGVKFGTVYARVHVGPVGQVTTIRPKKGKYLTIPLPAAMTKAGVARGGAFEKATEFHLGAKSFLFRESSLWGDTFIAPGKKGGLIIFGKKKITKGEKVGQMRGQIVPLFLLVRSVKVKARIHPEEILSFMEPKVIEGFKGEGIKIGD